MVLSVLVSVDERFALKVCRSVSDLGCLTSAFMILCHKCVNARRCGYQIGCRPFLPGNLFLLISSIRYVPCRCPGRELTSPIENHVLFCLFSAKVTVIYTGDSLATVENARMGVAYLPALVCAILNGLPERIHLLVNQHLRLCIFHAWLIPNELKVQTYSSRSLPS